MPTDQSFHCFLEETVVPRLPSECSAKPDYCPHEQADLNLRLAHRQSCRKFCSPTQVFTAYIASKTVRLRLFNQYIYLSIYILLSSRSMLGVVFSPYNTRRMKKSGHKVYNKADVFNAKFIQIVNSLKYGFENSKILKIRESIDRKNIPK